MKLSTGKVTLVDDKQVWRRTADGHYVEDIIALREESLELPDAQPLLQWAMRAGKTVEPRPTLQEARQRHAVERTRLAEPQQRLRGGEPYPVHLSAGLATRQHQVETALRRMSNQEGGTHGATD
jgi:hypothetical protein